MDLGDASQALGGDLRGVAVEHLLELAPGVRPAMGHADRIAALAGGARETGVAGMAIELQRAVEAAQERLGVLPTAVGGVEEDHPGRIVTAPGAVVACKGPEVAGPGPASARVQ